MIRALLRRWLGVDTTDAEVAALDRWAKRTEGASEDLERSVSGLRAASAATEPLAARLDVLAALWEASEGRLTRLEAACAAAAAPAAPVEVQHPVLCPFCGHSGLVIAAVETEVERARPEVTVVVGYGFACGRCKKGFYWETAPDGMGKTRAADAQLEDGRPPMTEEPEPVRAMTAPPRPRFRPQRRS